MNEARIALALLRSTRNVKRTKRVKVNKHTLARKIRSTKS